MKKKQLLKKNPRKNPGRNPLITGTIILTLTGFASRIIGFFYRIYLSRLFGEEGMGVYQLLNPVLALSFSVTAAGLQTSISKYVAGEISSGNARSPFRVLMMGLSVSLCLSLFCTGAVIHFSEWIAVHFLLEERTASMLRIIALSIPLSAVHACINGYYYGIRKTALPAFTQLLEQFCRIFCVYSAERLAAQNGTVPSINVAVAGLVVGEFFAMLVCIGAVYFRYYRAVSAPASPAAPSRSCSKITAGLLSLAVPLSVTRIVINLLQSVEAVYIPSRLQAYGYTSAAALSIYGVLTGMALPLIFFPNALTGSMSVLLLPIVSEADAAGNKAAIRRTLGKTLYSCLTLGCVCTLGFLCFGRLLGQMLFTSPLAGNFICVLSLICPFMYLGTTLSGILNGLGGAVGIFFINVSSLCIRLAFVFFLLPRFGIYSYIAGLLFSQAYTTGCYLLLLKHLLRKR